MSIKSLIGRKLKTVDGVLEIKSATYDGIRTNPETMELHKMVAVNLSSGDSFTGAKSDIEQCLVPEGA